MLQVGEDTDRCSPGRDVISAQAKYLGEIKASMMSISFTALSIRALIYMLAAEFRTVRSFARCACLTLLVIFGLAGCMTISLPPSAAISEQGAHAIHVLRVGPWVHLQVANVIPGEAVGSQVFENGASCTGRRVDVKISSAPGSMSDAEVITLCSYIREAIDYVIDTFGAEGANYQLNLRLIPAGVEERSQQGRWGSKRRLQLDLVFPVFDDLERTAARLTSASAHELFHVHARMLGLPRAIGSDELMAYRIGTCSQLATLSWVNVRHLPVVGFNEGERGVPGSARESAAAGVISAEGFRAFADGEGMIRLGSSHGVDALRFCESVREELRMTR